MYIDVCFLCVLTYGMGCTRNIVVAKSKYSNTLKPNTKTHNCKKQKKKFYIQKQIMISVLHLLLFFMIICTIVVIRIKCMDKQKEEWLDLSPMVSELESIRSLDYREFFIEFPSFLSTGFHE